MTLITILTLYLVIGLSVSTLLAIGVVVTSQKLPMTEVLWVLFWVTILWPFFILLALMVFLGVKHLGDDT